MPEWFINVVSQFPIVAIAGFIAWYAYREIKKANADGGAHERQAHTDALASQKAPYERLLEAKNEEIARLGKEFKDEVRKLVKVVTELNGRLNT